MKTKDEMLKVIKKWYADISVLHQNLTQKYQVVMFMKDNAGATGVDERNMYSLRMKETPWP